MFSNAQKHSKRTFVAVEHGVEVGRLWIDSVILRRSLKGQDVLDEGTRRRKRREDVEADHEICIKTVKVEGHDALCPNTPKELTNLSSSRIWNTLAGCIHFTRARGLLD